MLSRQVSSYSTLILPKNYTNLTLLSLTLSTKIIDGWVPTEFMTTECEQYSTTYSKELIYLPK